MANKTYEEHMMEEIVNDFDEVITQVREKLEIKIDNDTVVSITTNT